MGPKHQFCWILLRKKKAFNIKVLRNDIYIDL